MKLVRPLLLLCAAFAAGGCASWRGAEQQGSIAKQRQERAAEAVKTFEQQRDQAQLQAALDRWSHGDVSGCDSRLRALLARRPDDEAVRQHLAELLWSNGDAAAAEQELRQILASQPRSASAHHLLGLILTEQERLPEARVHLTSAAELEPASEVFRATRDALPGDSDQ
jgi:Flp pilus assembly protein TadD